MFTHAITRLPGPEMTQGLSSARLGLPDFELAQKQHESYRRALEQCGLIVQVLPEKKGYPDACFIEDVALCTPALAIVTYPGAPSRQGEISGIEDILARYYKKVEHIDAPANLEAGDVMMVGNHYYIGLSDRTNPAGAQALIQLLETVDLTGSMVRMENMLHLKSGLSYLENNVLLVSAEFSEHPDFTAFDRIEVPPEEAYAANSVWINGNVLVPAGFPLTKGNIESRGYSTLELEMSEFEKLDGGLSCLSLRF